MLAAKFKLNLTKEQYPILNEMFWKWASICTRMSSGVTVDELCPKSTATLQFSKTQLSQANTDVSDLKMALEEVAKQKERQLESVEFRYNTINECIDDESKRHFDPKNKSLFQPKAFADGGLLRVRFHRLKYWKNQLQQLGKKREKLRKTLAKIKEGKIFFKPTRISLHQNALQFNFGKSKIILKPFAKEGSGIKEMEIDFLSAPEQQARGSSLKSKEYLQSSIKNYIAYAINSNFFGLNRAEKMLLKAKKPDKIAQKEERMRKKIALTDKKIETLSKWLGRDLDDTETQLIKKEISTFFEDVSSYKSSPEYVARLFQWAEEISRREESVSLNKYPILIRKPINRYSRKKIKNLRPEEWEYFIQLSYEPIIKNQFQEKTVLGIDKGISHLLAVSIYDPLSNKFIHNQLISNPIVGWKKRHRRLLDAIRNLERRIRAQHNIHIHENQMKKRLHKIENRIDNLLHNVSRYIVNLAIANGSVIVMEDIKEIKQHGRRKSKKLKSLNYTLSLFIHEKIGNLIKYKAQKEGIPVYEIDPQGTSQNCAKCLLEGQDGKYKRLSDNRRKIGKCEEHGQIDADLNAARTIAVCYYKKLNNPRRVV